MCIYIYSISICIYIYTQIAVDYHNRHFKGLDCREQFTIQKDMVWLWQASLIGPQQLHTTTSLTQRPQSSSFWDYLVEIKKYEPQKGTTLGPLGTHDDQSYCIKPMLLRLLRAKHCRITLISPPTEPLQHAQCFIEFQMGTCKAPQVLSPTRNE